MTSEGGIQRYTTILADKADVAVQNHGILLINRRALERVSPRRADEMRNHYATSTELMLIVLRRSHTVNSATRSTLGTQAV
jgi:hypothetical protein